MFTHVDTAGQHIPFGCSQPSGRVIFKISIELAASRVDSGQHDQESIKRKQFTHVKIMLLITPLASPVSCGEYKPNIHCLAPLWARRETDSKLFNNNQDRFALTKRSISRSRGGPKLFSITLSLHVLQNARPIHHISTEASMVVFDEANGQNFLSLKYRALWRNETDLLNRNTSRARYYNKKHIQ
jgi:hypothetical protein